MKCCCEWEMQSGHGKRQRRRRLQLGANDFNFSDNDVDMAMDEVVYVGGQGKPIRQEERSIRKSMRAIRIEL